MHISTVYLSTYSQDKPIRGHMDLVEETTKLTIEFTNEEAALIQEICVAAHERNREEVARKILNSSIAVPQLAPPAPELSLVEDADFTDVQF